MERAMLDAIELSEPHIIQANLDQLHDGRTAEGQMLPDYSPVSVQVFGKRPGPWTLYDTGMFHNSFFLKTDNFPVLFDASDEKKSLIFDKLEDKGYVPQSIFGISKENKKLVSSVVKHNLAKVFKHLLGLR